MYTMLKQEAIGTLQYSELRQHLINSFWMKQYPLFYETRSNFQNWLLTLTCFCHQVSAWSILVTSRSWPKFRVCHHVFHDVFQKILSPCDFVLIQENLISKCRPYPNFQQDTGTSFCHKVSSDSNLITETFFFESGDLNFKSRSRRPHFVIKWIT